jgi:tRNA modification GTPase
VKRDTIAAIATPPGQAGIGIIRLSGPQALDIAARIFRPQQTTHTLLYPSHRLILGQIIAPEDNRVVDEVLLSAMHGPHSYTREDVVEINCHSGYAVLRQILHLTLQQGARLANPGEFTLRAFLSGRLDLTQAEAVLDIIEAKSDAGLKVAAAHLAGGLGQLIARCRESLLDLLAQVEADLDFGEEIPGLLVADLVPSLESLEKEMACLSQSYVQGRLLREGLQVVLAGRPNVGKSSLLNQLLQTDRALVTDIPGTTRDVIAEDTIIQGLPVCLLDTAGLRQAQNKVEELGIQRTEHHLGHADLVLYLVDASQPWHPEDTGRLAALAAQPAILVLNKSDLPLVLTAADMPDHWPHPVIKISALTGAGLPELKEAIFQAAMGNARPLASLMVTQERQAQHLERCRESLNHALELIRSGQPPELLALELQAGVQELGAILGLEIGEDVLDRIFSRFCLGK